MIWLARLALLVAGPAWTGPAGTEISKMEEQIAKLQADLAALAARVTALEGGPPAPTTYPVTLTTGGTGSGTVGVPGSPAPWHPDHARICGGQDRHADGPPRARVYVHRLVSRPVRAHVHDARLRAHVSWHLHRHRRDAAADRAGSERLPDWARCDVHVQRTSRRGCSARSRSAAGLSRPNGADTPALPVVAPPRLKGIGSASGLTGSGSQRLAPGAGSG
jgi:hypothetical protein